MTSFDRTPALPQAMQYSRDDVTLEELGQSWEFTDTIDPSLTKADVVGHKMVYSSIDDDTSRFYRLREEIRSRISYTRLDQYEALEKYGEESPLSREVLDSFEEYRINEMMRRLGFGTTMYDDNPSIRHRAERIAKIGTPEAFQTLAVEIIPYIGTKAMNQYITGVRKHNSEWASQLRELTKSLTHSYANIADVPTKDLGRTSPYPIHSLGNVVFPEGYCYTVAGAERYRESLKYSMRSLRIEEENKNLETLKKVSRGEKLDPFEEKMLRKFREKADSEAVKEVGDIELPPEFSSDEDGSFGVLKFDDSVKLTKVVKGYLHRRKRANFYGRRVRYPSRLLTDPQHRVFAEKIKAPGGVVVIDVSGSMSLCMEDVERILDAAPGALVVAYSMGYRGGDPNITILANRGKQVEEFPNQIFRGGNGVDGPALLYALKQRRSKEPLIWVSDGNVTSAHDGMSHTLSDQVAAMVLKYGIVQIPNVELAIEQLRSRRFVNIPWGFVGDSIREIRSKGNRRSF